MSVSIKEIAGLTGATVTGNDSVEVSDIASIDVAHSGELTFLYHPNYQKYFPTTKASAIIVKEGFEKTRDDIVYLESADPGKAFHKVIREFFTPELKLNGIAASASIAPTAVVGHGCAIGENVVIGEGVTLGSNCRIFHNTVIMHNTQIGDDVIIYPNVTIREESVLGNRVIIQAGAVIGADGFGYSTNEQGEYLKVPQIGNVVLEDDVEIGANTTIDRAALGSTIIKRGGKLDNLVQIAHNVEVGENTVMSSQVGVSGSTKIGSRSILAGQVGLIGHIEIGDDVVIYAQSGVSKSIIKPGVYFGSPATEIRTAYKQQAHIRNLPDYADRIKKLEKLVEELRNRNGEG